MKTTSVDSISIAFVRRSSVVAGAGSLALLLSAIAVGCGGPGSGAVAFAPPPSSTSTSSGAGSAPQAPFAAPAPSPSAPTTSTAPSAPTTSTAPSGPTTSTTPSAPTASTAPTTTQTTTTTTPPAPTPATPTASASSIVVVSGGGQTGAPRSTLPLALTVAVRDAGGQPVAGVAVVFAATSGTLSTTSATTSSLGQASTTLTLGALEGACSVTATAAGVTAAATFAETSLLAPGLHDYYVAQTTGASDANDGLSATLVSTGHGPWATVGHAASVARAGDNVHVLAGNYPESVTISTTGTASAPVRFYAPGGTSATIASFRLKNAAWVELVGFNVVGPKTLPSSWQDMPAIIIDDPSVGWIDPSISWTTRQGLVNQKYSTYMNTVNAFTATWTVGIWLLGATNVTIADDTCSLHTIGIQCDGGSSNLTITDNTAYHCRNGIWSYASTGSSFTSSTIARNHCYQNLYTGITAGSSAQNITIAANLCELNGYFQFEVSGGSSSCLLTGNTGRYGGYYSEVMQFPGASAFNFYSAGPGNVADGNWEGFELDLSLNDGNGFISDTSGNGVTFKNNVAYRNMGAGITFYGTSNNVAVNNTLVENGYQSTTTGSNGAGIRVHSNSTGNTIANNVFSGNLHCQLFTGGVLSSQALVDWNLYAPGVALVHDSYSTTSGFYATLSALRAIGREARGVSADPGFVDPRAPDFHLLSTSPAVGAGDPAYGADMGAFPYR